MKRLFETVEKSRVHCIFYDDFKKNPGQCYRKLLSFLDLPDDQRVDFAQHNQSVSYRSRRIQNTVSRLVRIQRRFGLPQGIGIRTLIDRFNTSANRSELRPELKREIQDYFRDDIALLSEVMERDLSGWQKASADTNRAVL